jgi:hypothetical protein
MPQHSPWNRQGAPATRQPSGFWGNFLISPKTAGGGVRFVAGPHNFRVQPQPRAALCLLVMDYDSTELSRTEAFGRSVSALLAESSALMRSPDKKAQTTGSILRVSAFE